MVVAVALFDQDGRLLGDLTIREFDVAPDVVVYKQQCYLRQGESNEYRQAVAYVVADNQRFDSER